jgi:hypothetical protein
MKPGVLLDEFLAVCDFGLLGLLSSIAALRHVDSDILEMILVRLE